MNHYLVTTFDQRVFLAPNVESPMHALALPYMPHPCDIAAIDEWQGDCFLTVYDKENTR